MKTSVIIPVFNHEEYLRTAIESVLLQTQPAREIILVHDAGSTDLSASTVDYFSRRYDNITAIYAPHETAAEGRNRGLFSAKGDFVLFLDADDEIDEKYLEKVEPLMFDKVDLVCTDIQYFGARTDYVSQKLSTAYRNDMPITSLIRKSRALKIGGMDPSMLWDDWDFYLRLLKSSAEDDQWCTFLHEGLFHYRIGLNNLSGRVKARGEEGNEQIRRQHGA